jgi:hypothetical protein
MTVTIWNTLANDGADAIATRSEIVGWTEPEGDASPEPTYGDPVPLSRLSEGKWVRPRWTAEQRADPAGNGASNFRAGERILDDVDVKPTLGAYDRLGARDDGVPNLDAGTMVWTWAKISAAEFDPVTHHAPVWTGTEWADPVARSLAELKTTKKADITARRWDAETGGIVLSGMAIATDVSTQAKLSGALQLVQADADTVIEWKAANGAWVELNATTVTAVAQAVGTHVQSCFSREKALHTATDAAEDIAALNLINVQTGAINGVGNWPSNGA